MFVHCLEGEEVLMLDSRLMPGVYVRTTRGEFSLSGLERVFTVLPGDSYVWL